MREVLCCTRRERAEGEVSVCVLTRVHTPPPKSVILQRFECEIQLHVPELTNLFEAQSSTFVRLLEMRAKNL